MGFAEIKSVSDAGNRDEPGPRDAAVVGLAERDQPVVERLAVRGGGAAPCPPTSR